MSFHNRLTKQHLKMSFIKNEVFNYESSDAATMNRKFAKTCVEKKRRDRINRCLDELKDLMSESDDKAKYQKMEKAEILEMAVTYMKNLRTNSTEQQPPVNHYEQAYKQCLSEFNSFLQIFPGVKDDFRSCAMTYMTQRYVEQHNIHGQVKTDRRKSHVTKKSSRYMPYTHESNKKSTPMDCMSITTDQNSLNSSSFNFSGSCSSLDSFQNANHSPSYEAHNEYISMPCSGSSSPSLSQCSSPISSIKADNNNLNLSSDENVWRPW